MKNAEYYIKNLEMIPHVEGGYFKESFLSEDNVRENKKLWSSIYFLLRTGEVSNFHRLKSDELWYYHDGEALTIYMITPEGDFITKQTWYRYREWRISTSLSSKGIYIWFCHEQRRLFFSWLYGFTSI